MSNSNITSLAQLRSEEPRTVFLTFAPSIHPQSTLRQAITAAYRRPETECLPPVVEAATLSAEIQSAVTETARRLIDTLRVKQTRSGVEALVQEYSLSRQEGVSLLCLAEALLLIPHTLPRDVPIRG